MWLSDGDNPFFNDAYLLMNSPRSNHFIQFCIVSVIRSFLRLWMHETISKELDRCENMYIKLHYILKFNCRNKIVLKLFWSNATKTSLEVIKAWKELQIMLKSVKWTLFWFLASRFSCTNVYLTNAIWWRKPHCRYMLSLWSANPINNFSGAKTLK